MNRVALAAIAAVVLFGGAIAALMLLGIWPGPNEAERAQARALFTQAEAAYQSGDQDVALNALNESIELDSENDALRLRCRRAVISTVRCAIWTS
ncbi:MAG TPA: hypothetical protein VM915_08090 [Verrucomicrobiae bacterium]|nr:hypothetical protein [Verrucomicrobiae bacterium]